MTLLAGCSVGPDFHRPNAPATESYTITQLPEKTASAPGAGGNEQRFIIGQEISAQWWTLFQSEALDQLIQKALKHSPTLAAAKGALLEAQENWRAQAGTLFPSVDANASASRQKISGASFGQPGGFALTLYN
ncbi:MAG TPA: TolC family protein, partial [Dissulfurispiraceae bacterium]|nr:TolC family protein [Dissulfurispiraceae bacterium]